MNMNPQNSDQAKKANYAKPAVTELSTEATHGGAAGNVEAMMMTDPNRKFNAS